MFNSSAPSLTAECLTRFWATLLLASFLKDHQCRDISVFLRRALSDLIQAIPPNNGDRRKIMKRMLILTAILLVASVPGLAQSEHPRIEAYGTYQLFTADIDALDNETLHGWGAGVQWNPKKWLGTVAEINGAYGSSKAPELLVNPLSTSAATIDVNTNVHTYLFGPRVSWRTRPITAFAHSLFGFGTLSVNCNTCVNSINNNKFAMALGGGIDVNITPGIAIRAAQFDYVPINSSLALNGGGSSYLRNSRFQAGVVFKFKR
jgi:opacity protein-like surface antigen